MNINYFVPFTDWLSISHANSNTPVDEVLSFLCNLTTFGHKACSGFEDLYDSCVGTVKVTRLKASTNISISGGVLSLVRAEHALNDLIMILGSAPYNITRLDAAIDMPVSGALTLQGIQRLYPDGTAQISSRSRKLQYLFEVSDGEQTGSCYFQSSRYHGHIRLKVYDKAYETLVKKGVSIPPTTRYELTVARGASLRDVVEPSSVLFHYMPNELLKSPKGVVKQAWKPTPRVEYDATLPFFITDYEKYQRVLETHPGLNSLIEHAVNLNGGSELLVRFIQQRIEQYGEAMQRSGDALGNNAKYSDIADGDAELSTSSAVKSSPC